MLNTTALTSSYINCRVRALLPTPPLPTIITLCTGMSPVFSLFRAIPKYDCFSLAVIR